MACEYTKDILCHNSVIISYWVFTQRTSMKNQSYKAIKTDGKNYKS